MQELVKRKEELEEQIREQMKVLEAVSKREGVPSWQRGRRWEEAVSALTLRVTVPE